MPIFFLALVLSLILPIDGTRAVYEDLRIFTEKDMYRLSDKIGKSLLKCKQLRSRPDVIVEVQNNTDDFFDKTKFSELIHAEIERKTHASPETTPPQFEILAKLASKTRASSSLSRSTYTLTAQLFQADEKLCEKRVTITKTFKKQ
jgi:hypothetical protein